ncbi:MAG TPA: hypothetical protein VFH64_11055 [Amnibacterium sp.]|nr:hypothetical protein [Amnibacterium sp.]
MTDVLVGYSVRSRLPGGDAIAEIDGDPVRLVRIAHDDTRAEAALEAWLPADGAHVQRVLDLGLAPNGDLVAVVSDVPIALVELLAVAPLDAGEAVTVLIPVAEALADLHAAGVAHGAVGAAAIGLTRAGAPVLLMPRTATAARGGTADRRPADRQALVDLARRLLPPPLPDAVQAALEQDPGGAGVDALFRLAEPRPVLLQRAPGGRESPQAPPGRLVEPASPTVERQPARMTRLLPSPAPILARLRGTAAAVRPRVWLAAGASLAALVAALLLLPGHGAAVRADPVSAPRATRAPSPSPVTGPSVSPVPGATEPLRAATALLDARARCLTSASPRCLDVVDAPGSPVDTADRAALAAGVDAVRTPVVAPELLRASGSTAVLAVGSDTVLEIREPDGWRLRDVIAPAPAVPTQMPSEPSKSPSSSRARTAERNRAASAPSTIRWS